MFDIKKQLILPLKIEKLHMENTIVVNVGTRKTKLVRFLVSHCKWGFHLKIIEKSLCNDKIKSYVVVLFLCFLTNMFAHNEKLVFFKQVDSVSIKKQDYTNNATYYELQKLKKYNLKTAYIKDKNKYLNQIHKFTKDSLQILAVKLISIKELEAKKLLDLDIEKNKEFYVYLLDELKKSDINPNEYLFLENKLSKLIINVLETKYAYSKWLNIILGISLVGLLIFFLNSKRKKVTVSSLSKQETTVKNLILKGKSNKEIANELFISLSTVKTHITNIYHKLNISNRAELTLRFKNTTSTSP